MDKILKLIKDHWIKPFIIIGLFLACLSISILMKKWFGMDGDYLSAFATLVAAVVAFHLYKGWTSTHNKSVIASHIISTHSALAKLNTKLCAMSDHINSIQKYLSNPDMSDKLVVRKFLKDSSGLIGEIGDLILDLSIYNNLLIRLTSNDEIVLDEMRDILDKYISIMDVSIIGEFQDIQIDFIIPEEKLMQDFKKIREKYLDFLAKNMLANKTNTR